MIAFNSTRREAEYRAAKPPVAGLMSFRCKCCGNTRYSIQGRKKLAGGGWKCADCCK